jgi:hypothetical protein
VTALIEVVTKGASAVRLGSLAIQAFILLLQRTGYKQQLGVIFNRFTAVVANDFNSNVSIWIIRYYIAAFFKGQGMESEL